MTVGPVDLLGDRWAFVPNILEAGQVSAVTAGGPGWVAVGTAVWTSTDGRAWTPVGALPGAASDTETNVSLVASTGAVLYAAGDRYLPPQGAGELAVSGAVWRSADGLTWESVGSAGLFDLGHCFGGCPGLHRIAAGPGGVIISGTGARATTDGNAEGFAAAWFSPDGNRWESVEGALTGSEMSDVFFDVAPWGTGFVATGVVEGRPVTWSSADGRHWTEPRDLPLPRDLVEGEEVLASQIAANGERLVVWGGRCRADPCAPPVIWTSADAVAWSEVVTEGLALPDWLTAELRAQGLFVVVGRSGERWTTWTSSDGVTWTQRRSEGLTVPTELLSLDLAVGPLGAILVGSQEPEGTSFALISQGH